MDQIEKYQENTRSKWHMPCKQRNSEANVTRKTRALEKGFTLIEVMLGLGVFMIGIMGVVGLQVQASRTLQNNGDVTLANNIAASKLDELNVSLFDNIVSSTAPVYYTMSGADSVGSGYFTLTWTVNAPSADLKDVLVTVTWNVKGDTSSHGITLRSKVTSR